MRRPIVYASVAIAALAALAAASASADEAWRPSASAAAAVARVMNATGTERMYGSGTLIEKDDTRGLVLSCAHLFPARSRSGRIVVAFADGQQYEGRLLGTDETWDLSLIAIASPGVDPVPIAADWPRVGEQVQAGGFGQDGRLTWRRGRVLGYTRPMSASQYQWLEMTGSARDGDSGGPILNERGELVAVCWGTDGQKIVGSYCGRVREFLGRLGVRPASPQCGPGGCRPLPPAGPGPYMTVPGPGLVPVEPAEPQGIPRPGPAMPAVPIEPAAPVAPADRDPCPGLKAVKADVAALKERLDALDAAGLSTSEGVRLAIRGELIRGRYASEERVKQLITGLAPSAETVEAISAAKAQSVAGEFLAGVQQRLAATETAASETRIKALIAAAVEALPHKEAAEGVVIPWLTAILAALGFAVPPGIVSLAGAWLLRRAAARLQTRLDAIVSQREATSAPAASVAVPAKPTAAPVVLRDDPPPQEPIVRRSREFVEIHVPEKRLRALERAMDEYVRKYPAARSMVETIERYADQFESGEAT